MIPLNFNNLLENVSLCLSSSSNRCPWRSSLNLRVSPSWLLGTQACTQDNWSFIPHLFHLTNHYWWSHHRCSSDQSPVMIRLFDNLQVIPNTNLELSGISYCIWVYIMFRYHNWYLNSQMWLDKFVLSRALISPKKQLESLSVSSFIRKKQSIHNSLYITLYIVLTSIIKNIFYPRSVVVYLSLLLIKLILYKILFYSLKETTTTQTIKTSKTRIPKKDES